MGWATWLSTFKTFSNFVLFLPMNCLATSKYAMEFNLGNVCLTHLKNLRLLLNILGILLVPCGGILGDRTCGGI